MFLSRHARFTTFSTLSQSSVNRLCECTLVLLSPAASSFGAYSSFIDLTKGKLCLFTYYPSLIVGEILGQRETFCASFNPFSCLLALMIAQ